MGLDISRPAKPKLVILSDLWGKEKSGWISYYTKPLSQHFDIQYYDCCELAGIDKSVYTQDGLHHQFVSGGIERAIRKLTELVEQETHILAFSIGGTIAWRFGLQTGMTRSLMAVSATRLRYEAAKPQAMIRLWYGEDDDYRPSRDWLNQMEIECEIVKSQGHLVYREPGFAETVASCLLSVV